MKVINTYSWVKSN